MVSTIQTKSKVMGALSGRNLEDILPILDAMFEDNSSLVFMLIGELRYV